MGSRQQSETGRVELILAAQGGDSVAIGRLLANCQSDIRRYARRHCAASDIDDAVQETLLVITRKVASLRAAAAFTGWLFTVIRRECQRLGRAMLGRAAEPLDVAELRICTLPDETLRHDVAAALDGGGSDNITVVLVRRH